MLATIPFQHTEQNADPPCFKGFATNATEIERMIIHFSATS
jgi:hypothetical protein